MPDASLRLLCTNDIAGTWDPVPASYGVVPGVQGLLGTLAELGAGGPAVWLDAGDLVNGALASLTGGVGGFTAAAELPIDLAVPGNHEFDWGTAHLVRNAGALPFPYLCGNVDAGLPMTALLETPAGPLGVVGLTYPALDTIHEVANNLVGVALDSAVVEVARGLRRDGATWVVAVLHDGVDVAPAGGRGSPAVSGWLPQGFEVDTRALHARVRSWLPHLDALVAGHTLTRWFGRLDGVPVAQPWAFTTEVGVIELHRDSAPTLYGVTVEPGGPWPGPGRDVLDAAGRDVLGTLDAPLGMRANGDSPLLGALADAARRAVGVEAAAMTIWDCYSRQAAVDGVLAHLPAGPVTEADIRSLCPYPDDDLVVVRLAPDEVDAMPVLGSLPSLVADGVVRPDRPAGEEQVAVTATVAARLPQWVGRPVEQVATGVGLRAAVREAVRSGTLGVPRASRSSAVRPAAVPSRRRTG